jgi:hypothetical protein
MSGSNCDRFWRQPQLVNRDYVVTCLTTLMEMFRRRTGGSLVDNELNLITSSVLAVESR